MCKLHPDAALQGDAELDNIGMGEFDVDASYMWCEECEAEWSGFTDDLPPLKATIVVVG